MSEKFVSKRSRMVGFTALGALGMLSGCGGAEEAAPVQVAQGETHQPYIFKDVKQCVAAKTFSREKCEEAFKEAEKAHLADKNSYERKEQCEAEYGEGNCEQRRGGRFSAAMMGYFIGRSMSGSDYRYSPLYRDRDGYRTASGAWLNNGKPDAYKISKDGFGKQTSLLHIERNREISRSRVAARGGFGGSSSSSRSSSVSRGG